MMNAMNARRFREAASKSDVQELRELANSMSSPWDKAEIQSHEVIVLVEMEKIPAARLCFEELKKAVALLVPSPSDGYEYDLEISLPLSVRYLEIRVAHAEGKTSEALQLLDELVPMYPKQLSIAEFREISQQLHVLRGFLLGDLGRWDEAESYLESASPNEKWKSPHCYYVGRCAFELKKFRKAKEKLAEAIRLDPSSEVHYILGVTEYNLEDMRAAKRHFEFCAKATDRGNIETAKLWEWLEATSMALHQFDEAETYHRLMLDSMPKKTN